MIIKIIKIIKINKIVKFYKNPLMTNNKNYI